MSSTNGADPTGRMPESDVAGLLESPVELPPAELLFRNTVEHAPVGIAFASRDGNYRHANRAFCALLGYGAEELNGKSVASLTFADDLAATTTGLQRLWRGEIDHLDIEKRYLRGD